MRARAQVRKGEIAPKRDMPKGGRDDDDDDDDGDDDAFEIPI